MNDLKTLTQHDAEVKERANQFWEKFNAESTTSFFDPARALPEKQNGIECPNCGAELWDSYAHPDAGSFSVFSRKVHCKFCRYAGWRQAGY